MMNYKEEYNKKIKENVGKVLQELDTPEMILKIKNWANRFSYSFEEIRQKIIDDEIFRCVFAKDPAKQNLYQTIAGKYISSLEFVKNFQILPASGANALFLDNGKILSGKELKNKSKETKSIDFYWEVGKNKFYATHKYTHEDGGAQDNQYIDVQTFLKNAFNNDDKNTYFLAICDGEYYLHKDTQTNCKTRIERLNKMCGKTSFAMQINELKEFLLKFV